MYTCIVLRTLQEYQIVNSVSSYVSFTTNHSQQFEIKILAILGQLRLKTKAGFSLKSICTFLIVSLRIGESNGGFAYKKDLVVVISTFSSEVRKIWRRHKCYEIISEKLKIHGNANCYLHYLHESRPI